VNQIAPLLPPLFIVVKIFVEQNVTKMAAVVQADIIAILQLVPVKYLFAVTM